MASISATKMSQITRQISTFANDLFLSYGWIGMDIKNVSNKHSYWTFSYQNQKRTVSNQSTFGKFTYVNAHMSKWFEIISLSGWQSDIALVYFVL